jgi:hypothetical protein
MSCGSQDTDLAARRGTAFLPNYETTRHYIGHIHSQYHNHVEHEQKEKPEVTGLRHTIFR